MENIIWLLVMTSVGALFTALGVFAWRREKPMWFWSGKSVREEEITDIPAYNRANGVMWIVFSVVFWISAVLGFLHIEAAAVVACVGWFVGVPALAVVWRRIYTRYKR